MPSAGSNMEAENGLETTDRGSSGLAENIVPWDMAQGMARIQTTNVTLERDRVMDAKPLRDSTHTRNNETITEHNTNAKHNHLNTEKRFNCEECGKGFKYNRELKKAPV